MTHLSGSSAQRSTTPVRQSRVSLLQMGRCTGWRDAEGGLGESVSATLSRSRPTLSRAKKHQAGTMTDRQDCHCYFLSCDSELHLQPSNYDTDARDAVGRGHHRNNGKIHHL